MVNLKEIIGRSKKVGNFSSDKEFASKLGISPPDFSKRKKSGTLLPLIIEWGIAEKVNLDWLLTGKDNPYIIDDTGKAGINDDINTHPPPSSNVIELKHMKLIKGFIDKQRALNINRKLMELERLDSESFRRVESYINGKIDAFHEVAERAPHYNPERRQAERRIQKDQKDLINGKDRRSGKDRRKASG